MRRLNPITASYLSFVACLAGFLVWLAESLESAFGQGVRDGIINSSHRSHNSVEEFGSTNFSNPMANISESTESNGFVSTSSASLAIDSSNETDDMVTPCCDHVPLPEPVPNTSTDIKPFDPYDPQDPNSVFNGDPLNFDPGFHSDPFGNN